jgi:glycosyltransferase involved in cell wall biosynthesis
MPEQLFKNDSVSVVCPTYNSSSYIQRTIDSLRLQILKPEEIIFSDDGSQDSTIQIIENNRDKFENIGIILKVLKNSHGGPGAARNNGIKEAHQIWIAFLDADDIWKKDKLSMIRKSIHKNPDSNCFLHWEEYNRINKSQRILTHGDGYYHPNHPLLEQLYRRNFLSTSAVVCKKSLLQEVGGFDVTLPNAQDFDLWLKMAVRIQLTIIPKVLGEYIEEQNSITARPYYNRFWSEIRIAFRYRKQVPLSLFIIRILRIILSKQWVFTLYNLLTRNRKHSY